MISVGKKWRRSENAEGKQREFHQMKRESSMKRDLKKTAVIVHVTLLQKQVRHLCFRT